MNDKHRDSTIDDLLRKRPKGPRGTKLTYTEETKYDYDRDYYRTVQVPDDPSYGYGKEMLFQLGLHSHQQVTRYVLDRYFGGANTPESLGTRKSTVTRRSNRIWERLKDSVSVVQRDGGSGIYEIKRSSYTSDVLAYVHALNKEEAQTLADMFIPNTDGRSYLAVQFVEFGGSDRLRAHNDKIRAKTEKQVAQHEHMIDTLRKKIDRAKSFAATLEILENHQLALEG